MNRISLAALFDVIGASASGRFHRGFILHERKRVACVYVGSRRNEVAVFCRGQRGRCRIVGDADRIDRIVITTDPKGRAIRIDIRVNSRVRIAFGSQTARASG